MDEEWLASGHPDDHKQILDGGNALENPFKSTMYILLHRSWGRPGFDVGYKAVWGIPRISYLVNPTGNAIVANDDNYALAA